MLVKKGVLIPLKKYDNCFLARTDPKDVARWVVGKVCVSRIMMMTVMMMAFANLC